ncbi:extracellular exonuclease ExeM [Shewanella benthica]|uniref:extracellular exonuclease ExeM n=1 Tax=Shewanella benthica TaxID=43661 RepID=UPI00187A8113|nr:extracellular exonuclease ExeM [Shewanella benthica]MBE7214963.1 extracellular exonuclease ExeM [Shewanella benthica]MCL1062043.1 extracellular exonuclease ExeM [Shewanella benthica]
MDNVKKLSVLALSIAAALPMMASADVIISEYVEGSGYSKAVEIYNSGTTTVDLAGYSLVYYSKGETIAKTIVDLSGNLAAEGIKVITNNHAQNAIVLDPSIDAESATIYFNGDDKIGILKDGVLVDILGEVGTTGDWAKDVTIERNVDIATANVSYVESEWTSKAKNDFAGLGVRSGNFGGGETPEVPAFSCVGENITPIYKVQGAGDSSPLVPDGEYASANAVTIKGIVTARGDSMQKGFYLQEAQGDGSPYTSDGIFVYLGDKAAEGIQAGVEVCVQGLVQEKYGQTQIAGDATKIEIGEQGEMLATTPLYVADGENLAQALERYEGMHIVLDAGSDMKITRNFSFDYSSYRNNMVLSHKAPLMKPTQVHAPLSDAAVALQQANRINELYVESDYKASNGEVPYFPDFNAETGYIRVGDLVTNISGVIGYSYNNYRLIATNEVSAGDFIRENDRTTTPAIATEGDIRVASFNVLNYFTDAFEGYDANPTNGNRGAETENETFLQRTKIVNAIKEMNADIIGLMEIENNGYGEKSAIQNLLNALNSELPAIDAYKFIEIADADKYQGKYIGGDAIAVGMLYRVRTVTPANDAFVVATPEQSVAAGAETRGEGDKAETNPSIWKAQRHSLGQTFDVNGEKLTVLVNHLKSKGSACLEDWHEYSFDKGTPEPADLQGHCNEFRVSAAKVIGESIKDIEGDILVIGDLNAYGMEDPVRVLTDYDAATAGYEIKTASWTTLDGKVYEREGSKIDKGYGLINLNTQAHGVETYSYSYSGELGNLDHALGNASVAARLVDIQDWHINSVESSLFEYPSKYTGELLKSENVFSASDHDPVIIALSYPAPTPTPEPTPEPKKDDGGSLGYLGLAMLSLLGLRRRKH